MPDNAIPRSAVVAPGVNYGADAPLLMYARLAAERRGAQVRAVSWQLAGGRGVGEERAMVISQVAAAADEVTKATGVAPLLVGKSLGSLAAAVAADRGLAAVWFTPLLYDEPTAAALRRTSAPCLLVGGTADRAWDGKVARSVTPDVVEIADADHGMFVSGALAGSAAVLSQVITAVEDFLDRRVWP
jgi:hypothetical protein